MQKRRLLGIALLFAGLFFILNSRANITGAAVGAEIPAAASSIFGIAFIVVSVIMLAQSQDRLEERLGEPKYRLRDFDEILPPGKKRFIIFDTCSLEDYEAKINQIYKEHSANDVLVVPISVFLELPIRLKAKIVELSEGYKKLPESEKRRIRNQTFHFNSLSNKEKIEVLRLTEINKHLNYQRFKYKAVGVLKEASPKRRKASDLYKAVKSGQRLDDLPISLRDLYNTVITKVLKKYPYMQDPNYTNSPQGEKLFNKAFKKELAQYGRITKGDRDVVAASMYGMAHKWRTIPVSEDSDVEESIKLLKVQYPRTGRNLNYASYRI